MQRSCVTAQVRLLYIGPILPAIAIGHNARSPYVDAPADASVFFGSVRRMRSGAVVCPASSIAAGHTPRARMEMRGPGPKSFRAGLKALRNLLVFPAPSL